MPQATANIWHYQRQYISISELVKDANDEADSLRAKCGELEQAAFLAEQERDEAIAGQTEMCELMEKYKIELKSMDEACAKYAALKSEAIKLKTRAEIAERNLWWERKDCVTAISIINESLGGADPETHKKNYNLLVESVEKADMMSAENEELKREMRKQAEDVREQLKEKDEEQARQLQKVRVEAFEHWYGATKGDCYRREPGW